MSVKGVTAFDQFVFWITSGGYVLFILVIISAFSKTKLIRNKFVRHAVVVTVFQPRFAVYTKEVGLPEYQVYKVDGTKLMLMDQRPFVPQYYFGLRRNFKLIGAETDNMLADSMLLQAIPKLRIEVPYGKEIEDCVAADTIAFISVHPNNVYYLKGKILLSKQPAHNWKTAKEHKTKVVELWALDIKN